MFPGKSLVSRRRFLKAGIATGLATGSHCLWALANGESKNTPTPIYKDKSKGIQERVEDLLSRMSLSEKVQQLACSAPENQRLGIPSLVVNDALHCVNCSREQLAVRGLSPDVGPTVFPQAIALGSTWNPALVQEVAEAIAREARCLGIHQSFSPVLDVARDPRFGRVEETYGEDPVLVSRLGVAYIAGLQGTGTRRFDSQHLLATAKHFAGYQESTGGLNGSYANVSKRTLYEMHFPPFEAAVKEAGVASVMPAHTDLDGIPAHMNTWLLEDVLRTQWAFPGFVVSDNIDIYRLFAMHHVARNEAEAAILALKAGVDIEIDVSKNHDFSVYQTTLLDSISKGLIDKSYVDRAVRRILEAKFRIGLFDNREVEDPVLIGTN